ncbi:MAG TPA: AMP-dependent synthetase/ligase [Solirubrobacterales bacterium]|nr:AMP-dependent synthetase/ligase [Solirubrobacterales bacterium]
MEVSSAESYVSGGPAAELQAQNLYEAFAATVERLGDDVALRSGEETLTWTELAAQVGRIAGGLASLGVRKGDTVALMLSNRPEFVACDMAAVALGAVPFSIYQTSSPEQIAYVVGDAGARVAIVEAAYLDVFRRAREELSGVEHLIVLDADGGTETLAGLEGLDPEFDPSVTADALGPDDLLTLIYTSGTTGPPKGVQLTHRNLLTLVSSVDGMIPFPERGGRVISWLPAAHIAERGANYYLPVAKGLEIAICPDPRGIVQFLPQAPPTWFFAVPRVWEKLKAGLEAMLAGLPDEQREPAERGFEAALEKVQLEQRGEAVPEEIETAAGAAEEQMFGALRHQLGLDEAVAVSVGAAPTPVEVLEFFHAIGIPVGELWGMSETCGVATSNPLDKIKLGTVGPPVPGTELKLAEDGEVLVRSAANMPGYRNMPEKTAETIDADGWLHTGDIGELDDDGYLRIVDRKKELIINAAGKNMSPASIESKLKAASPLIGQVAAVGDGRRYNVALIVLDPDYAPAWAQGQGGIEDATLESLAEHEAVRQQIEAAVGSANERMARVEQIKKFKILPTEWAPGGDELTPTMKLKRKPIEHKYAGEIDALYTD